MHEKRDRQKGRQVAKKRLVRRREGRLVGGQRGKKGLHWPLSDIATIGISQTMAAAADMSMHIW